MDFPRGNKLNRGLPERSLSSAKILEEHLKKIDYKVFAKVYFMGLFLILITIFSIIVTIRLANFTL